MSERNVNPNHREASCDSVQAGLGALPTWLIHHAARRAPAELAERLEEEWQADAAARSSALSRLRFAVGCCWATSVIALEHVPARAAAASGALGPKIAFGDANESDLFARRSITLFLVAGLHVGLFYALMTGLGFTIIKEIPTAIQTKILQTPHERVLPPLPPPPMTPSRIDVPPPDFPTTEGPIDSDIIAKPADVPADRLETPPVIVPHDVTRVPGGPGTGFPNTDDYYPSIAKRLEEQGIATVRVCVGANGRLTSDPTIAQTSGNARLDDGALLLAKAGSGHYRAATEDGRAVDSCYAFRVRFALRTER
jgi:TonB family protein